MPRSLLRYRFGIGSVMVGVILVSAILSQVVRRAPPNTPVAQFTMGGEILGGTAAGTPGGIPGGVGGFSSMGGGSPGGTLGTISGDPGGDTSTFSGDQSGDIGGIDGGSSAAEQSSKNNSSAGGGEAGTIGIFGGFSSMGGPGGDIGVAGGQSSQGNASSAAPSSAAAQSSSAASSSSAPTLSSPPPIPSSAALSSAPPPRCGDGNTDFGESCDPCAPSGRSATDANCNAVCAPGRCGDGFTDRRRGEECDYVGLIVDEAQSPFVVRDESTFARCVSDSTCAAAGGGYCLYGHCWPLKWLAYWGWTDAALCPQTWSKVTSDGSTTESIGGLCNDFANARCREFLGDGCTISCKLERCGDQIVQAGYTTAQGRHYGLWEECDDGNTTAGDGCSDRCTIERQSSSASSASPPASSARAFCDEFPHLCVSPSSIEGLNFDFSIPTISSAPAYVPPPSSAPPQASSAPAIVARVAVCGDGQIDEQEECDNGLQNSDTVAGSCRLRCRRASCGDFVADYGQNEQCDQGVGNSATEPNRCRPNCTLPRCGDAVVDRGETCDDGNPAPGDGCSAYCIWETIDIIQPRCGDGRIQGGEQCDDANSVGGDGCSAQCQAEFVLGVMEQLNPVLVAGGAVCGDGVLVEPEECDDGNPDPGDGCSPLCTKELPVCGNGILEIEEQCDDGHRDDTDGCNAQCQIVMPPKPAAPPLAQVIPEPLPYAYIPVRAPVGDTGPAAIAMMASGAAAGVGWMRRRRKNRS